jgi:hypothetical protein
MYLSFFSYIFLSSFPLLFCFVLFILNYFFLEEKGVHFAGEHLSVSHAWIIGALNSASRAVREILVLGGYLIYLFFLTTYAQILYESHKKANV